MHYWLNVLMSMETIPLAEHAHLGWEKAAVHLVVGIGHVHIELIANGKRPMVKLLSGPA